MNKIRGILKSRKSVVQIPVKVGSHEVFLNVHQETKCSTLVQQALTECKISLSKGYALFEKSRGIDRQVKRDQNIWALMISWDIDEKYELIVKKCRRSPVIINSMIRNKKYGNRLFKLGKEAHTTITRPVIVSGEVHLYEMLDTSLECESDRSCLATNSSSGVSSILNNFDKDSIQFNSTKPIFQSNFQHFQIIGRS